MIGCPNTALFYVLRSFIPFRISQHRVSIKGLKQANMTVHVNSSWAFRPMRSIKVSKTCQNLGIMRAWIREKAGEVPRALTNYNLKITMFCLLWALTNYNVLFTQGPYNLGYSAYLGLLQCYVYLISTYGLRTLL